MKKLTLIALLIAGISFGCDGPKQTTTSSDGMSNPSTTMKDTSMMKTDTMHRDTTKPH